MIRYFYYYRNTVVKQQGEANQPLAGQAGKSPPRGAAIMRLDFMEYSSEVVETSGESSQLAFEQVVRQQQIVAAHLDACEPLFEFDRLRRGRPQFLGGRRNRPERGTSRQRAAIISNRSCDCHYQQMPSWKKVYEVQSRWHPHNESL